MMVKQELRSCQPFAFLWHRFRRRRRMFSISVILKGCLKLCLKGVDVPPTVVPGVVPTVGVGGSPIDPVGTKPTGRGLPTVGDSPTVRQLWARSPAELIGNLRFHAIASWSHHHGSLLFAKGEISQA